MPTSTPDSTIRLTDSELLDLRSINLDERELSLQQREIDLKLSTLHDRKRNFLQGIAKKYGLAGEISINITNGEVLCRGNDLSSPKTEREAKGGGNAPPK